MPQVLILEDVVVIQKFYSEMFRTSPELEGITLHNCRTISDAELVMQRQDIDLFIVDWLLGKIKDTNVTQSGLDFVKKVRNHYKYEKAPIVMVTSVSEREQIHQALRHKIDGYILKPIVREMFVKTVCKNLSIVKENK